MMKSILIGVGIIIAAVAVLVEEAGRNGSPVRVFMIWLDPTMPCVTHARRMIGENLSAWDVEKQCRNNEPHKMSDEEGRQFLQRMKQLEDARNRVHR